MSIKNRVHGCYWDNDYNCPTTALKVLEVQFDIPIESQVYNAVVGIHGAGGTGGLCGLVAGPLLFLGIIGKKKGLAEKAIIELCKNFSHSFTAKFGSLQCSDLRPGGFSSDDPPHLCESLSCATILFTVNFVKEKFAA